ncbi:hypothetical protein MPER_11208, partial [Moniliophthora perniciosa FA553]
MKDAEISTMFNLSGKIKFFRALECVSLGRDNKPGMIRPEDVILDETGSLDKYGHVYRARLRSLNQVVAVKILSGDAAAQ